MNHGYTPQMSCIIIRYAEEYRQKEDIWCDFCYKQFYIIYSSQEEKRLPGWVGGSVRVITRQQKMIIFNILTVVMVQLKPNPSKMNRFNSLCAFYLCSLLHVSYLNKNIIWILNLWALNRSGLLWVISISFKSVWWFSFMVYLTRFKVTWEIHLWACLWGSSQRSKPEVERPTLNVRGTILRTGVPDRIKRKRRVGHQHPSLTTSSCGYHVTICRTVLHYHLPFYDSPSNIKTK